MMNPIVEKKAIQIDAIQKKRCKKYDVKINKDNNA